jgi:hypothetical protein
LEWFIIQVVQIIKYLGSILESTGVTTTETEKRICDGRRVTGILNLWSKISFTKPENLCTRLQSKVFYYVGQKQGNHTCHVATSGSRNPLASLKLSRQLETES